MAMDLTSKLRSIYDFDLALEPEHEKKENRVRTFLEIFKEFCLRKNQQFADYFHDFYYTGSYYEGLRVKMADEFDINLVFNIPAKESVLEIEELGESLPYMTVQLKPNSRKQKFKNLFFLENGYLSSQGFLSWLQFLLCWFRDSLPSDTDADNQQKSERDLQRKGSELFKEDISFTNSGPARTIKLLYRAELWISVDLVPVFRIQPKDFVFNRLVPFVKLPLDNYTGYLVPKVLSSTLFCVENVKARYAFRIHLPEPEVQLIAENKWVRKLIKLAKALNEKQKWKLPSYFVKVAALSMVRDKRYQDMEEDHLGDAFMLFLDRFEEHLRRRHLGHLLFPNFNLFLGMSEERLEKLQMKVQAATRRLSKDTRYVFEMFGLKYEDTLDNDGRTI